MTDLPKYRAPALQKGLSILETLAHASGPMSMADLSAALSRSRNEIFRMLQVMEDMHYIARDPSGGYTLTNRLFALGMQQPPIRDLLAHALPAMHSLAEDLGQSCHLAVASGSEMVVIARVEAPGLLGFAVRVGYRRPLHLSASGQMIMAFQPAWSLDQMLADVEAAGGPIDREALDAQLARIRADGHVALDSATITAIIDLSTPILVDGYATAALTVPFVSSVHGTIDARQATARLVRAAEQISHEMAGTRIA